MAGHFLLFVLLCHRVFASQKDCILEMNNKCYEILQVAMTYANAEIYCKHNGGFLLALKDGETANFLKDHLGKRHYWLGLKDNAEHKGSYVFSDGTPLQTISYSPWLRSRSGDVFKANDCVVLNSFSMGWYTERCEELQYAICQFNARPCDISELWIENAELSDCDEHKNISAHDTIFIKCIAGYVLQGPANITCGVHGKWSTIPSCVEGCANPFTNLTDTNIRVVRPQAFYPIGDSAVLLCENGYFLNGRIVRSHVEIICEDGGAWANMDFECSPVNNLRYQLDSYKKTVIQLGHEDYATLSCLPDRSFLLSSFLWFKEQEEIYATDDRSYDISKNGNLEIRNFTDDKAGIYVCVASSLSGSKEIVTYILQKILACQHNKTNDFVTKVINEGSSLLLNCPLSGSGSRTWYKDGLPMFSTKRATILANDGIFIPKVLFSDSGIYTCRLYNQAMECNIPSYSVKVVVAVVDQGDCGSYDESKVQPWLATLWWSSELAPFCYATLIHEFWLLTSAHCIIGAYRRRMPEIVVQFNKYTGNEGLVIIDSFQERNETSVVRIPVELVFIHPKYSSRESLNDIGLIKLMHSINSYGGLQPLCVLGNRPLSQTNCAKRSMSGFVTAWGPLENSFSEQMKRVYSERMWIVSPEKCDKKMGFKEKMLYETEDNGRPTFHAFCAQATNTSNPVLAGDSGAPFIVKRGNRLHLAGIYSWGERLPQIGRYDYFTNVSHYYSWILLHVPLKTGIDEMNHYFKHNYELRLLHRNFGKMITV